MPGLLTTASIMTCPHGGTVQAIPADSSVTAGGAPLVTASDTFLIAGCAFVIGVVPSPCLTVQWVQPATGSTKSQNPTLTEASTGLCLAATMAAQGPVLILATQPNVTGQ
jgi:hypothetical protein